MHFFTFDGDGITADYGEDGNYSFCDWCVQSFVSEQGTWRDRDDYTGESAKASGRERPIEVVLAEERIEAVMREVSSTLKSMALKSKVQLLGRWASERARPWKKSMLS